MARVAPSVTWRQVVIATGAFLLLLLVGTVGFAAILDESPFDAFYRTIITVYTAGLVEAPQSGAAKAFTLFLVIWGVAVFFYVFALVVELTVSGALGGAWQERRTQRTVSQLRDHYIICGYGRVGRRVGGEFREAGVPYVVVDQTPDAVSAARSRGELLIEGVGTDDAALDAAGLAYARGLVASSDSDVDNLYITLSARAKREGLLIVARAATTDAAEKLRLAGANRVVQPYATAGQEMAKLVLKPQVAAFLDIVTSAAGPDIQLEEVEVSAESAQAGRTIRELRVRHETGAVIIAIHKPDGTFETTPSPDLQLEAGDVIIAVGTEAELRALEGMFAPREAVAG